MKQNQEDSNIVTYLLTYLSNFKNKNKNRIERYTTSIRLNPEIYEKFNFLATKLFQCHKRSPNSGTNILIEGLLQFFNDNLETQPQIVQTTFFYKPQINKIEVNIATKLELKLIKKDMTLLLARLENGEGDQRFLLSKLKGVLPKAIQLYEKTQSQEVLQLLERTEKWI